MPEYDSELDGFVTKRDLLMQEQNRKLEERFFARHEDLRGVDRTVLYAKGAELAQARPELRDKAVKDAAGLDEALDALAAEVRKVAVVSRPSRTAIEVQGHVYDYGNEELVAEGIREDIERYERGRRPLTYQK